MKVCYSITEISWDFNSNDRNTWGADFSPKEMNVELSMTNNELRGSITGANPIIDSPSMFLYIMRRNYCVIRMAYTGIASSSRLVLMSAPSNIFNSLNTGANQNNSTNNITYSSLQSLNSKTKQSWEDSIIAIPSTNTHGLSDDFNIFKLSDSLLSTYYLTNFTIAGTSSISKIINISHLINNSIVNTTITTNQNNSVSSQVSISDQMSYESFFETDPILREMDQRNNLILDQLNYIKSTKIVSNLV